ncbi:hypothetical protein BN59_01291 [Legionella massiliensis]|uniref:Uncharacterized protein n=1 Tax=Legionella massiliensis TaxID=1034943 RepID=A0A078KVI5_9GAMM|nr:hypothetical protein [Legionella massiliensis]CDZ77012.1 hypothetical protein BN59_01291 [Legionella massiliensis]CEE12750.1 hypothetical protein BN1094_01291 [Legionella massiliensis]
MQAKIELYKNDVEQFIDDIRRLFDTTEDLTERANRQGVFDTLLTLATYATPSQLESEFKRTLPREADETLNYLRNKLKEINGVCTSTLSTSHELYSGPFLGFADASTQQAFRNELSDEITRLVLGKMGQTFEPESFSLVSPR